MCDEPTWPELPFAVQRDPHLRTTGENEMLAPLVVPVGRPQRPSVTSPAGRNSGPYPEADGGWAYTQDGVKLFRFDELGSATLSFEAVNLEAATVSPGLAVTAVDGGFELADQVDEADEIGLLVASTGSGQTGEVQTHGPLTLPDWTAATGSAALLVGKKYWLREGGQFSRYAPAVGLLRIVGRAADAQTLVIQPQIIGRRSE